MASATVYVDVQVPISTREAIADLTVISEATASIIEDQPWNEDAKEIAAALERLLSRVSVRSRS